jgi:hypothetical protein
MSVRSGGVVSGGVVSGGVVSGGVVARRVSVGAITENGQVGDR